MKFKNPITLIRESLARSERERIIQEVDSRIQIREFDHKIYVSYNGLPLLTQEDLNDDICDVVSKIRDNVKIYKGV